MFVIKFINNEADVADSFITKMREVVLSNPSVFFSRNPETFRMIKSTANRSVYCCSLIQRTTINRSICCRFNHPETFRMIKSTANRSVYCCSLNERILYIKLYSFSSPIKYLKHLFRYSHGIHGYKKSIRLLNEHVSTATPVLAMSYLGGLRSLVVHEAIPGVDAEEFFVNCLSNKNLRSTVLKKIGALIAELFSKGFSHGDMNFGGFIVDVKDENVSVSLIDVDNITNNPNKRFRDIVNFNAHLFVTAKKVQIDMLSHDELREMYLSILSIYDFGMTEMSFFQQLNQATELKLIKWGQKGYIAI